MKLSLQLLCNNANLQLDTNTPSDLLKTKFRSVRLIRSFSEMNLSDILYIAADDFDFSVFQYYESKETCTLLYKNRQAFQSEYFVSQIAFLDESKDSVTILNCILAVFDKYHTWDNQLNIALNSDQPLQKILTLSIPIFQNGLYVADSSFKILALADIPDMTEMSRSWNFIATHGYLPTSIVANMEKDGELEKLLKHKEAIFFRSNSFYNRFISKNLYIDGKFQGRLFIIELTSNLKDYYLELADRLAEVAINAMKRMSTFSPGRGDFYEHFLIDILSGRLSTPSLIQEKLSYWEWDINGTYSLLLIMADGDELMVLDSCQNELEQLKNTHCTFYENILVTVTLHQSDKDYTMHIENLYRIINKLKKKACISECFSGFEKLKSWYDQLKYVFEFNIWHQKQYLVKPEDYALSLIFRTPNTIEKLHLLCSNKVKQLAFYDKSNKTFYYHTLLCFLEHERSLKLTSATLNIHRNTLIGRIEKISQLFDLDLDNPSIRKWLLISFHIWEYLS